MRFYDKLRRLRKEKGLSQEELSEMLDVSRQAVSKWESGASLPELDKMITLADIFGVTLDSLIKDGEPDSGGSDPINQPFYMGYRPDYEYKSKRMLFGLPLVHINVGRGMKRAKGVVAVGNIATGLISVGLLSKGLLSFGVASAGLLSLGAFSLGLLASVGAISAGFFAAGAVAVGVVTVGAMSIGVYSLGACSVALRVAVGDRAYAAIAVGRVAKGTVTFIGRDFSLISAAEVKKAIFSMFPDTWNCVADFLLFF